MGQRGPKKLPSNVHRLRGNPSKLGAGELLDEVRPPVEIPSCPNHLLPDARKEWRRITPLLEQLGLIAKIDLAALAVYCQSYGRWRQAELKIRELNEQSPLTMPGLVGKTPSGYEQVSVWLQISNRSVETMHKFLCEFGMSPSARSRVTPSDVQPFLPGLEPAAAAAPGAIAQVTGFKAL